MPASSPSKPADSPDPGKSEKRLRGEEEEELEECASSSESSDEESEEAKQLKRQIARYEAFKQMLREKNLSPFAQYEKVRVSPSQLLSDLALLSRRVCRFLHLAAPEATSVPLPRPVCGCLSCIRVCFTCSSSRVQACTRVRSLPSPGRRCLLDWGNQGNSILLYFSLLCCPLQTLPKLLFDPRFAAIPPDQRKRLFEKCLKEITAESRRGQKEV